MRAPVRDAAGRLQNVVEGPDAVEVAFQAVVEVGARTVLEVGCGMGGLAGRVARELGAELRRHFSRVERRDVHGAIVFADRAAASAYVAASVTRSHLADRLPAFDGPLRARRIATVFVAER